MAMEMHVLSDLQLGSMSEWQKAIDSEGYRILLPSDVAFTAIDGFLPVRLEGLVTGFECFHDDASEVVQYFGAALLGRNWKFALGFRWRGDVYELQAAAMAATAYAASVGGVVFDHQEAKVMLPDQARDMVRVIIRDTPRMQALVEDVIRKISAGK